MNLDQARELDLYILDSSKACLSRNMVQGISITLRCSKPFKRKSTHLEMATCKVPAQNFNASYLRLELSTRDLRYFTSSWLLHDTEASTIDWDERDIHETGTQQGHRG